MKTYKNDFDLFQTFNASKFNAENGINESLTLWDCEVENVEHYSGISADDKKVYFVGKVISAKIMQGKTRSGIKVHFIYDSEKTGCTIGFWCNIKDFSNESGARIIEEIKKKLAA